MKGFFENFLALSVKKLKKVLMILPSISGRGRAFPAESCCYTPCLAICNFYRRWTPKLENLTLADWAAWYDNCSSKPYVKETHEIDIDGLPLQKNILMMNKMMMMMMMNLSRQQAVKQGDVLKLGF